MFLWSGCGRQSSPGCLLLPATNGHANKRAQTARPLRKKRSNASKHVGMQALPKSDKQRQAKLAPQGAGGTYDYTRTRETRKRNAGVEIART